jgi:hypothetical protein
MPMTMSCATPIASGSSRAAGAGMPPATAAADELATVIPHPESLSPASIVAIQSGKRTNPFAHIREDRLIQPDQQKPSVLN